MLKKLDEIKSRANDELSSLHSLKELDAWRVRHLGRKSELTQVLRGLAALSLEERKAVGASANEIRVLLEKALNDKRAALKDEELATAIERGRIDVTLPGRPIPLGRLHPTTQMVREICDIFVALGFPMLLRTHTSPMQIRVMERTQPPVRVVVPGKVYRYEATDATHETMLYQIEGLAVDENITLADLKGALFEFARRLFGEERRVRFRCDYFPFVEPGVEMAIDCFVCGGSGCRLCSGTGWIEILGAGMVHPDVLRRVNYDPEIYTGFAFGLGVERIAMLRYGIEDIRLFYSNDLRFLRQF